MCGFVLSRKSGIRMMLLITASTHLFFLQLLLLLRTGMGERASSILIPSFIALLSHYTLPSPFHSKFSCRNSCHILVLVLPSMRAEP